MYRVFAFLKRGSDLLTLSSRKALTVRSLAGCLAYCSNFLVSIVGCLCVPVFDEFHICVMLTSVLNYIRTLLSTMTKKGKRLSGERNVCGLSCSGGPSFLHRVPIAAR
jgi:hypothetical protein